MIEHYSVTRVVLDQLRMIKRARHTPVLITLQDFKAGDGVLPDYVEVRAALPTFIKIDYKSSKDLSQDHTDAVHHIQEALADAVKDLDAVFTHDIIFTGWNLPINLAVQLVAGRGRTPWFHWVHSVPGGEPRDYWALPENSQLVYPNHTDRRRCAENFGIMETEVLVVPHCLDARDFLMTTDAARFLANECELMDADFVQTMPIPTDRMESKGVDQVIPIFGNLKKMGYKVRLVLCNSWCTNEAMRTKVENARIQCRLAGLDDDDVVFTSRELKHLEMGLPNATIRDLMLISNLFICPTKSETFGFTIAEAALTGQLLVLNADLPASVELMGAQNALFFHFGSYQQQTFHPNEEQFYSDVAKIIVNAFNNDLALKSKNQYKKQYRSERVWQILETAITERNHGNHSGRNSHPATGRSLVLQVDLEAKVAGLGDPVESGQA